MPTRQGTTVEVIPSARRLIGSLRDVGYDFPHAVADLVDNSIAAKASKVDITFRFDGEQSWVRVADDGQGMSGTEITEAMRFGAERDYELDDLGKFGLGLKTASLSQCRSLIVGSRVSPDARRIEVRKWDLDHVEKSNRWEIFNLGVSDRPSEVVEPLQKGTGTVVLWKHLDRMLGYKIPWGKSAKKGLLRLAEELDFHLGMVFHRFLNGEARRRKKLKITINGTTVEPWDPFARDETDTREFDEHEFQVQTDAGPAIVRYRAYILPRKDLFSSPQAFERYSGPNKWNRQQGFYVFRADRLIQSGGWSYMRTADEHTKFARAALDFLPDADSAFGVNVAKARVNLPNELRENLRVPTERFVAAAKKAYSRPSSPPLPRPMPVAPKPTPRGEGSDDGDAKPTDGSDTSDATAGGQADPTYPATIGAALDAVALEIGEHKSLKRVREALRQQMPEVADEIGW